MNFKKYLNRTLALGLTITSVYVSTQSVYALEESVSKDTTKSATKVELKVEDKETLTKKTAVVKTSVLNVREEASQDAEKSGALVEGMVVRILETEKEWTKVQYGENKEGWVSSEFIANEKATVNTHELNLRKSPSTEEEKLEVLKRETGLEILGIVEIKSKDDKTIEVWYEVKVVDEEDSDEQKTSEETKSAKEDKKEDKKEEKTGYVYAEHVLTETEEAKLEEARIKAEAAKAAQEQAAVQNTLEANKSVSNAPSSKPASNKPVSNNKQEPVKDTSSGNLAGRTITVNASAYSGHGITSTGTTPRWGTIAVDPSVIPYGTKVYIPMFDKVFIAEDCGSAIKGNKIDIFMNSEDDMYNFGRRNIEIKILG